MQLVNVIIFVQSVNVVPQCLDNNGKKTNLYKSIKLIVLTAETTVYRNFFGKAWGRPEEVPPIRIL